MPTLSRRTFATALFAGVAGARTSARRRTQGSSTPTDLAWLTLTDAAELVRTRKVSATELVTA